MTHNNIPFEDYRIAPPAPEQLEQCLHAARRQLSVTSLRDTRLRTALRTQMGYLGWWFWAAQGCILALFSFFILYAPLLWPSGQEPVLPILAMAGPVLTVFSAPHLAKSQLFGMAELEAACLYPLPRLTALRLLLVGLSDFAVLSVVLLFCAGTAAGWLTCAAVLFIPFNLSCFVCFAVLGRLRGGTAAIVTAVSLTAIGVFCSNEADKLAPGGSSMAAPLLVLTTVVCIVLFGLRIRRGMKEAV